MTEPYLGEMRMFAGTFAPKNWAFCDGQLLAVSGNEALFSLLDTTYGGDGRTTFGLPDLRGRLPVHYGSGIGLTSRPLGTRYGLENVTLKNENLPAHGHGLLASQSAATASNPAGAVLATQTDGDLIYVEKPSDSSKIQTLNADSVGQAGGGRAHSNLMPSLCLNFIIAMHGVFPSRN